LIGECKETLLLNVGVVFVLVREQRAQLVQGDDGVVGRRTATRSQVQDAGCREEATLL
jgi:hypothetical protein